MRVCIFVHVQISYAYVFENVIKGGRASVDWLVAKELRKSGRSTIGVGEFELRVFCVVGGCWPRGV